MRIGILGGTFDPIHLGHLAAARAAMECADLDRVLVIPTGVPPHRAPTVAGASDRLEMSRLATAGDERFEVSDMEVRREGASYTVDTLRELHGLHPKDELFLILGWDAAKLMGSWHEPDEVRRLARVIIVTRPGSGSPTATSEILCERPTPDISGSALRRAIAKGELIEDRVPEAVVRYIAKRGLYGGSLRG
ncbi:MAG TPA: nicotinate-nucleotide adenylyltransferase [Candidatus Dormibacteraeota bacterium]|nr:nicotinate-nucleotide adenylyltransferase [Candidatus Dormibacteraeota bacterium]